MNILNIIYAKNPQKQYRKNKNFHLLKIKVSHFYDVLMKRKQCQS